MIEYIHSLSMAGYVGDWNLNLRSFFDGINNENKRSIQDQWRVEKMYVLGREEPFSNQQADQVRDLVAD